MDIERGLKENSFVKNFFGSSLEVMNPSDVSFDVEIKIIDIKSSGFDKIRKIDQDIVSKMSTDYLAILVDYVFTFIESLSSTYPSIEGWGYDKVRNGLMDGTRSILLEWRDNKLVGVSVLKNDGLEKKICCLRIAKEYQNLGIGVRLFKRSFEELGTTKPLLSVSETALPKFKKIFDHFGFEKTEVYPSKYVEGIAEISFNGYLK